MNIICCCHRAKVLTGSEVYFLELSTALSELGHDVTLVAPEISLLFRQKLNTSGIKCHELGIDPRSIHKKYIPDSCDMMILSHVPALIPYIIPRGIKTVNIIHSEFYPLEIPYFSDDVVKYVGIRQSICDKLINEHNLDPGKVQLIRNPIDLSRFNAMNCKDKNYGLFVGTMGGLRYKPALHFSQLCKINGLTSIYVGPENEHLPFYDQNYGPLQEIEMLFKNCTISGGIVHGRTYYEARLCGKKTVEYLLNMQGQITEIQYEDIPNAQEFAQLQFEFDKLNVAHKIRPVYVPCYSLTMIAYTIFSASANHT